MVNEDSLRSYIIRKGDMGRREFENGFCIRRILSRQGSSGVNPRLSNFESFSKMALGANGTGYLEDLNQGIYYITKGSANISLSGMRDDGEVVNEGYLFLVPPGRSARVFNRLNSLLEMLAISESPPENPSEELVIVDGTNIQLEKPEESPHWCHRVKVLLTSKRDNLILTGPSRPSLSNLHYALEVFIPPMSLPEPHPHKPGHDEVWYALKNPTYMALKERLYRQNPGTTIIAPTDGVITHTSINPYKTEAKFFFFMHIGK